MSLRAFILLGVIAVMSPVTSTSQRGELAQSCSQLVGDLTNQRAERQ